MLLSTDVIVKGELGAVKENKEGVRGRGEGRKSVQE